MLDDENEFLPPKDEEVPPRLAQKWDAREKREGMIQCANCQKQILAASSFCAYCGEPVEELNRHWIWATTIGLLIILLLFGLRLFI